MGQALLTPAEQSTESKQYLEDTAGLLVDQARDTLDATTASQTPDSRLGDALDVVAQHLPVPLGTTLAQSLASLATARHACSCCVVLKSA